MLLVLGIGAGMLIILAAALRPQSHVKRFALGFIATVIIGMAVSFVLLMTQAFGACLLCFFGTLLVAAYLWSQMFIPPPGNR